MRGKWNHICLSISTVLMNSKQLNLYLNGGLALSLTTNTSVNPATGNNFSLFSNNSGTIDSNTFGKVYYGNCRLCVQTYGHQTPSDDHKFCVRSVIRSNRPHYYFVKVIITLLINFCLFHPIIAIITHYRPSMSHLGHK
jgi:hypothetical protein